jgi:hypothetical protein
MLLLPLLPCHCWAGGGHLEPHFHLPAATAAPAPLCPSLRPCLSCNCLTLTSTSSSVLLLLLLPGCTTPSCLLFLPRCISACPPLPPPHLDQHQLINGQHCSQLFGVVRATAAAAAAAAAEYKDVRQTDATAAASIDPNVLCVHSKILTGAPGSQRYKRAQCGFVHYCICCMLVALATLLTSPRHSCALLRYVLLLRHALLQSVLLYVLVHSVLPVSLCNYAAVCAMITVPVPCRSTAVSTVSANRCCSTTSCQHSRKSFNTPAGCVRNALL